MRRPDEPRHLGGAPSADVVAFARHVIGELDGRFDRQALALADALETASPSGDLDTSSGTAAARQGREAASRHLAHALASIRSGPCGALARALESIAPSLRWSQTEAYLTEPPYRGFLDHYAHAALLGSAQLRPLLQTSQVDVRLGVLLLGPFHAYPPHAHPAEEIYLPLAKATWSAGPRDEGRTRPGRSLIHHEPWQPHGVTTGANPLLAVYLWLGETTASSRFLGHPR